MAMLNEAIVEGNSVHLLRRGGYCLLSTPHPPAQQDFVLPSRHSQVLSVVLNRSATYAAPPPPTFSDAPTPMTRAIVADAART